jgi:hypothetical protein
MNLTLLNEKFENCSCGRKHICLIDYVKIGKGVDERNVIEQKWDKIINLLKEAPSFSECTDMLFEIGLSYSDFIEFYGIEKIKDAVLYAKDLKDRYTVLWLNYKYFKGEFLE